MGSDSHFKPQALWAQDWAEPQAADKRPDGLRTPTAAREAIIALGWAEQPSSKKDPDEALPIPSPREKQIPTPEESNIPFVPEVFRTGPLIVH